MDWLEKSKKNIQETKEIKKEEGRKSYDPKSSGMDPELMDLQTSAGKKVSVKEPQKTVALNKIHKLPENKGKEEKKERTLVLDESRKEVKKELSLKERLSIYNDKEKERRVQQLIENKIPVPQDRDELISMRTKFMEYVYLVNTKGDYLLNSEGKRRLDQAWKPDADPLIVENYEWLMQYFTAHDTSIDQNRENDKAIPAIEFKDHEASMDMPGMKEAYERQGTSNCYACAGTAMVNQFIAMRKNEEKITRRVGQYDMRAYRPMIRKYDPATENVMDKDEYAGNVANVNFYAGAGKTETGNIFALGDFMLDTLEKNGISDVMLNRMVFRDPKIDKQKGDNEHDKSVHNNMQAVFADKIAGIIRSGAIAGVLIQEPGYSHYVTVTGIKGDELTVYDSAMYQGKSDTMDISSILQRGRTVEINWLSDMKKPEEMTKEYQNLQYDPQTGYSLKKVSHTELGESATHTKGITVLKEGVEMGEAYEQIAQFSYIPDPLAHVETQTLEEAVGEIGEKQETVTEEIKEEKKEAVPEEAKEEKKEAVSEEAKEEKYSGKKLSSSKRKKLSFDSGLETIEEIDEERWEREEEKHQKKLREGRERYEKLKIQERKAKEQEAEMHQKLQEYNAKKEEERKKREAKNAQEVQVRSVIEGDFSKSKKSVRKEAVKTQKAFEKAYKDYQTFGLGSDLRNTDIVAGDRRYMRGVKNALANYLNIRDALFEKYGYAEMKAEDIGAMNMHTSGGVRARRKAFKKNINTVEYIVSDQDSAENDWRMRNLTEDETKTLADAYEIVNEAAKDYLEHHGSIFKFGRGRSRVKQVRRLRDRLQLDNIRFGLSRERRNIKASLDKKYSKEDQSLRRELHPTWHKCILFNDVIDTREIGHREKRRRQRAEGKVPAWYKRVWSWTKRGFKNSGCRLMMAYNAIGGLIDRGLGLATAVVANTISLTGKTVKLPLKAISCIFNGISSLKGSKKRWDVSIDPRKDWKSIDDGRKIFRRYLKGACLLPMAVIETLCRGLPSLFGHYYKSGVYKRTRRWTKAIYGDIKRVAEGVGIKDYGVADRAAEDTEMAGYITAESVEAESVLHGGEAKTFRSEKVVDEDEDDEEEMAERKSVHEEADVQERKSVNKKERKSIHAEKAEEEKHEDEEIKEWGGYKFGTSKFKKRNVRGKLGSENEVTVEEKKAALGPDVMAEKAKAYRDKWFYSDHAKKYLKKAPGEKELNDLIDISYSKLQSGKQIKQKDRAGMAADTRKKLAMQAHLLNEYKTLLERREEERELIYKNIDRRELKNIEKKYKTNEAKEALSSWLIGKMYTSKKGKLTESNVDIFYVGNIKGSQVDMLAFIDNTDISEFKYDSDEEFVSNFAVKYEKLCKLSAAGYYLTDISNHHYSAAKLGAISEMASAIKAEYEDRVKLISSPYHAALQEKDLRSYLGKNGEEKINAIPDKELAEYLKLYRKVEKNRIGKSKGYKPFMEEKIALARKNRSRADIDRTRTYIAKIKEGQTYAKKIKQDKEEFSDGRKSENSKVDTGKNLMIVYRQQKQLEASKEIKDDIAFVKETRPGEDYTAVFGLIIEKEIYEFEKTVASFAEKGEVYGVKIDEKHKPGFMKLFNEWVTSRREWLRSKKAYYLCGELAESIKCDMQNPTFLKTKEADWLLHFRDENGAPDDQILDYRELKAKYMKSFLSIFEYLHKNGYPMSENRKYEKRLETKETIQEAMQDELDNRKNSSADISEEQKFTTVTVNGKTYTAYQKSSIISVMAKQSEKFTFEGEEGKNVTDLLDKLEKAEEKYMVLDRTYGGAGGEKFAIHHVLLKEYVDEYKAAERALLPLLDGKVNGLEEFMPEDMKKNRKKAAAEKKEEKK